MATDVGLTALAGFGDTMDILVTGADGQLGTELRNVTAGSRNNYIFSDVTSLPGVETLNLDITNIDAVRIVCDSEKGTARPTRMWTRQRTSLLWLCF